MLFRVTNAPEFVKIEDEKAEAAVKKNNTVFADETGGPRVSNVLFAKGEGKAALGETRTASVIEDSTKPKYPAADGEKTPAVEGTPSGAEAI